MDSKQIKQAGLKVTSQRVTLLEFLRKPDNQHISVEQMYLRLQAAGEDIGINTVYRVLNHFAQVGIIERHFFEGEKAIYELKSEHHHDHLVCLQCGKVVEFHDDIIAQRQKMVAHSFGMALDHHNLCLYGYCVDGCSSKQNNDDLD